MLTSQQYVDMVNRAIAEISYPEKPAGLYEPIRYALAAGGKRLRPMLLMAAADACGMEPAQAIDQAVGIEMFHNFTLLHDDVMDRADTRHGIPTVHCKWNDATAILSGDTMITLASRRFTKADDAVMSRRLATTFDTMAIDVYEGQQLDMDFEGLDNVTYDDYTAMIARKTGALIAAATGTGAMIAGAPAEVHRAFVDYGMNLGLAFQLQDDWLDTYGDPAVFGKKIGGDILNDKNTALRVLALEMGSRSRRTALTSLDGRRDAEKIELVKAIYDETGVADRCRALIDTYVLRAAEAVGATGLDSESREFFTGLAEKLKVRRS